MLYLANGPLGRNLSTFAAARQKASGAELGDPPAFRADVAH